MAFDALSALRAAGNPVDLLPEEQRAALTLVYYGNKTHVEIAQELDAPLGTIKSRVKRAHAACRSVVDRQRRRFWPGPRHARRPRRRRPELKTANSR